MTNPFQNPVSYAYTDVKLPSGKLVRIRETNGNDDDILSQVSENKTLMAPLNFLAGIIVSEEIKPEDLKKWKIRDKYYLILKSRIFSLGSEMRFNHTFADGLSVELVEDLARFDWDLTQGNPPAKGEKGYKPEVIQPYIGGDSPGEFTLNSGKVVKYDFLTVEGEMANMGRTEDDMSINDRLRLRNFKLKVDGVFQPIEVFGMFTARDMREIRTHLDKNDPEFSLLVEAKANGKLEYVSLFQIPDFFFPVG